MNLISKPPTVIIQLNCNENAKQLIAEQIEQSKGMFKFEKTFDLYTKDKKEEILLTTFNESMNVFKRLDRDKQWSNLFRNCCIEYENDDGTVDAVKTCVDATCDILTSNTSEDNDDKKVFENKVFSFFEYMIKSSKKEADKEYVMAFSITTHYRDDFITYVMVCGVMNDKISHYVSKEYASATILPV